jgi:multidrug resistance efflux pump
MSEQRALIQNLEKNRLTENDILQRFIENSKQGLISIKEIDAQRRNLASIEEKLLLAKARITSLKIENRRYLEQTNTQLKKMSSSLARANLAMLDIEQGKKIHSPCDCTVENILYREGEPVQKGQAVLTLSKDSAEQTVVLYISTSHYRVLGKEQAVNITIDAYPSAKYGYIKGTIHHVSGSPVKGKLLNANIAPDDDYYIATVRITDTPENIQLVTGMAINSNLMLGSLTIIEMLLDNIY